jgi:hypothetical protein
MLDSMQSEQVEAATPLIDMEQLEWLFTQDEAAELFDGECRAHAGCQPILDRP